MVINETITLIPIDWAQAFNSVAPLVTEAEAYLKCGKADKATEVLEEACVRIRIVGTFIAKCEPGDDNS